MRTVDERAASLNSTVAEAMRSVGVNLRVAMPGIIRGWDKVTQTVKVQVAIREKISSGGEAMELEIPLLVDVPVVMPRAGGYSLALTPKQGDECLVVFGDMCIDAWWQSGGVQSQADKRRHDLSDGFAILGCWSQPNKPTLHDEGIWVQSDDGSSYVNIIDGTVTAYGKTVNATGQTVNANGDVVNITGETVNITGSLIINGQAYASHTHGGVEAGSDSTGGVENASEV